MIDPTAPGICSPRSRTRVKICGLTRPEDAEFAAAMGADALGVVFAESPRRVDLDQACRILDAAPGIVGRVGVFANQERRLIMEAAEVCRLDWIQLSGDEPSELLTSLPVRTIRAFHVSNPDDLRGASHCPADMILLDSPPIDGVMGGTGRTFDWRIPTRYPLTRRRVILAGGLTPANVEQAINIFHPACVDVSSGVESDPGIKDRIKLNDFIEAVHRADEPVVSQGPAGRSTLRPGREDQSHV